MSIVAFLEGKFLEFKPCRNTDYCQAVFSFPQEVFGQIFQIENMSRPPRTNVLFDVNEQKELLDLKPGQKYRVQCSLRVRQPNEKDGRKYPAQLNLNILKTQPC